MVNSQAPYIFLTTLNSAENTIVFQTNVTEIHWAVLCTCFQEAWKFLAVVGAGLL